MDNEQNYFDIMMKLSDISLEAEKAAALQEEIQEGYFVEAGATEESKLFIIARYPHYQILHLVMGDYIGKINAAVTALENAVGGYMEGNA